MSEKTIFTKIDPSKVQTKLKNPNAERHLAGPEGMKKTKEGVLKGLPEDIRNNPKVTKALRALAPKKEFAMNSSTGVSR